MNKSRGLWRGRRRDNNEWIIGAWLDHNNLGVFYDDTEEEDGHIDIFQIDPSTLGECTGLRDKNDKLIFEGDTVKVGTYTGKLKSEYGVIKYDNSRAVFFAKYSNCERYLDIEDEMEVVGNIHDNPSC